jgi:hypothetical protein
MTNRLRIFATLMLSGAVLMCMESALGQGRGGGRGHGGSSVSKSGVGRPSGVGVERGISTSSERSGGRADTGRETASVKSNGRSDAGLERARLQRQNLQRAGKELHEHPQMAARLHTTANDLRRGYEAALQSNPDLPFGHYVAATRLGTNLRRRNPNITRDSILAGLADGKSIGRTLRDLGLNEEEASSAKKRVDREIRDAKKK